jgi:hypothetical protein
VAHALKRGLIVLLLVAATSQAQTWNLVDHQVMFQDTKLAGSEKEILDPFTYTNAAWSIGGYGCSSTNADSTTSFINKTEAEIESRFQTYIATHAISASSSRWIMLDIELPINPQYWGDSQYDSIRDDYLLAVKRRVDVARSVFPNAELTLYAVVTPPVDSDPNNAAWNATSFAAFQRAGELGVYDNLDALSPHCYMSWGPDDNSYWQGTVDDYLRVGVDKTAQLTKSDGTTHLPVWPLISFYNYNGSSANSGDLNPTDWVLEKQIHPMYNEYTSDVVDRFAFWAPDPNSLDIAAYLTAVGGLVGDVNQDRVVDLDDAASLREVIVGDDPNAPQAWYPDVDLDQDTDSEDVRALVQDMLGYDAGDASLDHLVDLTDLGLLAGNWNQTGLVWHHADFSADGQVDLTDLGLLAANWGSTTAASMPAASVPRVPEPATGVLMGLAVIGLLRRRRAR